jgi:predicted DNA-binding transcriptional regulator YafY
MAKREFLLRYLLIIKRLQKGSANFKELSDYLDKQSEIQDLDLRISKRTLQRDIIEIRSLFSIDIEYSATKTGYYISDSFQSDSNARMLEAFEMFNALKLTDELTHHIHFEKRKPQGTEYFYVILHAIKSRLEIAIGYFKYEEEETIHRKLQPLLLKEFKGRWYLIAIDTYDGLIKTYGLDRITDLDFTKTKFEYPTQFNPDNYYKHCFGVVRPNDKECEVIILSFDPLQGKYIKSFPLHHSQKVLIDNKNETQVCLRLYITYDFIMELLQYGDRVRVLKPSQLVDEIKKGHSVALSNYT